MPRQRQSGITLIEMLVVMTLIGVLAAVAAPSVGSSIETLRWRSATERMAATFRTAHERALRLHHYMEVGVDPKSSLVELRDLQTGSLVSWEIPHTVSVKADRRLSFLLYPDGGVQAMQVRLENGRGRQAEIVLDSFTLLASVREVTQ